MTQYENTSMKVYRDGDYVLIEIHEDDELIVKINLTKQNALYISRLIFESCK